MRELVLQAVMRLPFPVLRQLALVIASKRFRHRVIHQELGRLAKLASVQKRPAGVIFLSKSGIAFAREVLERDFYQALLASDQLSELLRRPASCTDCEFIQRLSEIVVETASNARGTSASGDDMVAQITARAAKEIFSLAKESLQTSLHPPDLRIVFRQSEAGVKQALTNPKFNASEELKTRLSYVHLLERLLLQSGNPTGDDHDFPLGLPANCAQMQRSADSLLAPWRESLGYRLLLAREAAPTHAAIHSRSPVNACRKILFICEENWFFLGNIISALEKTEHAQCRTFDFSMARSLYQLEPREAGLPPLTPGVTASARGEAYDSGVLKQLIDWADVVFVEWCRWPAVWASTNVSKSKQLILRLHSFEAFSPMPHFMNWGNVDRIVFVADHIRQFFNAQLNDRVPPEKQIVIDNLRDLSHFTADGPNTRDYTLGMVGYNDANKNPRLALQLLKALRAGNSRWTLQLVGALWPEDDQLSSAEKAYKAAFFAEIATCGLKDAVLFKGSVPWLEINRTMCEFGIILSCSDREGTHEAIVEGIASGCIPLIRNWPTSASNDGARNAFSGFEDFVFDSIDDAIKLAEAYATPAPQFRRAIAKRGRSQFDQQAVIGKILSLFQLTSSGADMGADETPMDKPVGVEGQ